MLLSDLVDEYVVATKANTFSASTKYQREKIARYFLAHVGNVQVHNITEHHVDSYFAARQAKGIAPQSLNVDLSLLREFWRFAMHRKAAKSDIFFHRREWKVMPKFHHRIPASDFPRILDSATHPRDRAILALGIYLMLRRGEITSLRVSDCDLVNRVVYTRIEKSHKADEMPMSAELETEMRRWLTYYTSEVGLLRPDYHLVPAKTAPRRHGDVMVDTVRLQPARRMTSGTEGVVQRALQACGYATVDADGATMREGIHTLRRSAARALFDTLAEDGHDKPLRVVQAFLHHSSQSTTERYIGVEIDRRQRDDLIKGRAMFPTSRDNVTELRRKA